MRNRRLPYLVGMSIGLATASTAESAFAQETAATAIPASPPATTDDADLARLRELLSHFASQSRSYFAWGGVAALAAGGATIASGIVMLHQGDAMG